MLGYTYTLGTIDCLYSLSKGWQVEKPFTKVYHFSDVQSWLSCLYFTSLACQKYHRIFYIFILIVWKYLKMYPIRLSKNIIHWTTLQCSFCDAFLRYSCVFETQTRRFIKLCAPKNAKRIHDNAKTHSSATNTEGICKTLTKSCDGASMLDKNEISKRDRTLYINDFSCIF